jgi:hypothetical protein
MPCPRRLRGNRSSLIVFNLRPHWLHRNDETMAQSEVKFITRGDRTVLTLGNLPATDTERWVMSRKVDVVEAVHGGLITMEDACWRYALTIDEFRSWEVAVERLDGAEQRPETRPRRIKHVQA